MPNRTLAPKHLFSAPKPYKNSPKLVDPELGRFDPFSGQTGFGSGRRFGPAPSYTLRPERRSTVRRPCRKNFKANRRRTRPDWAGERGGGHHDGSPDFAIFRPFQADPYLPPNIFGPSKLILVVLFFIFLTV